jgi:hypothetical protein
MKRRWPERMAEEFMFRTSIPAGMWRTLNMGVEMSKQVDQERAQALRRQVKRVGK